MFIVTINNIIGWYASDKLNHINLKLLNLVRSLLIEPELPGFQDKVYISTLKGLLVALV